MRIALDLDGTLVDFMGAVCAQHNQEYGTSLGEADITAWDFLPLTRFASWAEFWPWVRDRRLFARAEAYPQGPEVARKLMTAVDHRVTVVTHRPRWAETETNAWLIRHRMLPEIIWSEDKTVLDFDLFIDDSPDVIGRLCQRGVRTMRMVRPWNQPVNGAEDITGWPQIAETLL